MKLAWIASAWLALAFAFAGCSTLRQDYTAWIEDDVVAPSEQVLWHLTLMALEKEGFPVGAGIDPNQLEAKSGWQLSLQPFAKRGWREQATVKIDRGEGRRFKVKVRVQKEMNHDNVRPLDPSFAKWEQVGDNTDRARVLLQRIRAYVGEPLKVGDPERPPFER